MSDRTTQRSPRVVLLGAAPDTGNLGVNALCFSTLDGLAQRGVTDGIVFDFATHRYRPLHMQGLSKGRYRRTGSVNNRRYYRSNNLMRQWHLAPIWPFTNPALRAIRRADVVLSMAGGDSFTDLYGEHRFNTVTLAKLIALSFKKPLVLPQTYGPFRDANMTKTATNIIRQASLAWARDEESYQLLQGLTGKTFDPNRYMLGVDVAFSLPVMEPDAQHRDRVEAALDRSQSGKVVGFNVSSLLYNDPKNAMKQYGLKADYHQVVSQFLMRLINETRANIVLVPHVVTEPGHYESDIGACRALHQALCSALTASGKAMETQRLFVSEAFNHPSKVKWLIKQCDWFCGTRMHSTIAGLSTCTPTAAIAYSKKTQGVFNTCGVGQQVVDPRQLDTDAVIEKLWQSWNQRERIRQQLQDALPAVLASSQSQFDRLADYCHKTAIANG